MQRTPRPWLRVLAVLAALAAIAPARGLETDQYYAWGRKLADVTDVLNARVNGDIATTLADLSARPGWQALSCDEVARHIVTPFRAFIFHDIELWAVNTPMVARVPATDEEELQFRQRYLYHISGPLDFGTKIPPSPTIELAGIRIGTDKLSHFFSEGWWYYKWYRKALRDGRTREQAETRAIRRGILVERTILGSFASGVFSPGDLEANYQGLRFFVGLCDPDNPDLSKTPEGWRLSRPLDFRDYVTPEWDESYQPAVYGKRRWKKVRPVLVDYCPMLNDPEVVARRRDYASRDVVTPTERYLKQLVERGKLSDPARFSLDRNCPQWTRLH